MADRVALQQHQPRPRAGARGRERAGAGRRAGDAARRLRGGSVARGRAHRCTSNAPIFEQIRAQQQRLSELLTGPALGRIIDYQTQLGERMVAYASEVPLDEALLADEEDDVDPTVWFGARSWHTLSGSSKGSSRPLS